MKFTPLTTSLIKDSGFKTASGYLAYLRSRRSSIKRKLSADELKALSELEQAEKIINRKGGE